MQDSYTTGGVANGSNLLPPVLTGSSPKAGGRTTNGPVWAEDIANDYDMRIMDYAVCHATSFTLKQANFSLTRLEELL
jgi:hypothetical protein